MSVLETLKKLLNITDTSEDTILEKLLDIAQSTILNRRYPFGIPSDVEKVPDRYISNQLEIAKYLYLKQGAEGQIVHDESGVRRTYSNAHIPEELLIDITPLARLL